MYLCARAQRPGETNATCTGNNRRTKTGPRGSVTMVGQWLGIAGLEGLRGMEKKERAYCGPGPAGDKAAREVGETGVRHRNRRMEKR